MRILIIGGCGYVGSAIFRHLDRRREHVIDTIDLEWFGNHSNKWNMCHDFDTLTSSMLSIYDVVVHTAAHSSVPLCKDIHASYENNVTKLLNLVKKMPGKKLIYASSSCVYVSSNVPQTEESLSAPIDGLTLSKTVLDMAMPLMDIEYYGLRFGSVNGAAPNMRSDLMINSMTYSGLVNKQVNVYNGDAMRPIVSTFDLARAVEAIIDCKEDKRGIYNVASFNENIRTIGQTVADVLEVPMVDNGNTQTYDFMVSSEKFKKAFDFEFVSNIKSIVESVITHGFDVGFSRRDSI